MTERRRKKNGGSEPREFREELKPKTQGHKDYIRCMVENSITFCTGPAGSSKSYTALGLAAQYLLTEQVDRIIIARPTVEASPKGIGFLPGGLNEKMNPYVKPAVKHLERFLGRNTLAQLRGAGRILVEPLEFMRGETYDRSFIIGEEFQNADTEQIIMFITRIGENSKIVVNGDMNQTDLRKDYSSCATDLEYVIERLRTHKVPEVGYMELSKADIVRHKLIAPILEAFDR